MKNAEFMEFLLLISGKSFHYTDYWESARLKAIILVEYILKPGPVKMSVILLSVYLTLNMKYIDYIYKEICSNLEM
jgi:hypothetical protein